MLRSRFRGHLLLILPFTFLFILAGCSGPDRMSTTMTADASTPEPHATSTVPGIGPPTETLPPDATESPTEAQSTDMPQPDPTPTPVDEADPTETPSIGQPDPTATPSQPAMTFDPDAVNIFWEQAGAGFTQPVFVTHANDGSGTVYVLEKVGTVKRLDGSMVLDIRDRVIQTGVFEYEHEQGMLGLAFHPNFASNGYFYVHYNDIQGNHVYSRFTVGPDGTADRNSESIFLTYHQPEVNFQGGMLLFGLDGYLYIGTGTGGTAVELQFLAQELNSVYGKILRIDVDGPHPYGIPSDNPFVHVDGALGEIWAYGLRNPWRFSFDRATGDLYIGGPGQFTEEWIDFLPAGEPSGQNFGWPIFEGTQCWESWTGPCDPAGLRMPILTYPTYQNGNCVVIGGYVNRDQRMPLLNGAYFFGDYCSGNVWTGWQDAQGTWQMQNVFQLPGMISSFGEDESGTLYICDINNGLIYRINGSPR